MFSAWPRRERACPRQSLGPAHTRTVTAIAIVAILTIPTGVATIPAIPTTTDRPLSVAPSSFSMAAVIITIMTSRVTHAVWPLAAQTWRATGSYTFQPSLDRNRILARQKLLAVWKADEVTGWSA